MTTGSAKPGRIITQLSTDTKPTLDTKEAGTTLKYTDTGTEFEWSGAAWYQTKGPDSSGALAVKTTSEITNFPVFPNEKQEYRQITLDGSISDSYVWTDFAPYTHLTILATITGGAVSRAAVNFDISSDQSGRYSAKVGFASVNSANQNAATAVTDLATTNCVYRDRCTATAVNFYVSTTGAGETIVLDVIASGAP